MYNAVKTKIRNLLKQSSYISFTSDIWTSTNNHNVFLSLTVHWIDSNWNRRFVVISLKNLEDSHTGQLISRTILDMLDTWGIENEKRGVLVKNNGASMIKAAQLTGLDHLGCYIHTIQLVVNRGLKVQPAIIDAIAIARALVGHFRHSSLATDDLYKIQKSLQLDGGTPYPTHRLVQDVATRWNSTFYMLERLIEQKRAIAIYCQDNEGVKNLKAKEWNLMERVITTLRPFEQETKHASMTSATAGMIILSVRVLRATLTKPAKIGDDNGMQTMRAEMLDDLKKGTAMWKAINCAHLLQYWILHTNS